MQHFHSVTLTPIHRSFRASRLRRWKAGEETEETENPQKTEKAENRLRTPVRQTGMGRRR
jgi:hypothetical protein